MEYIPKTVKDLYDETKAVYDKKFNRYLKEWHSLITETANKGIFRVTLFVCDWDCDEGEPHKVVRDAIEKIEELFKGIMIIEECDRYCPFFEATWDLYAVESTVMNDTVVDVD